MLVEHSGIKQLEQRFAALRPKFPSGKMQLQILKLRSTFRRAVRSVADHKQRFTKSWNGYVSFLDWKQGFEFARSIPSEVTVMYAQLESVPDTVFFFSERALRELNDIVDQFDKDLREFEDLVKVQEVIDS